MMPFRSGLPLLAVTLLFASAPVRAQDTVPPPEEQAASRPTHGEGALARARVAVALRDSLLRLNPDFQQALTTVSFDPVRKGDLEQFLRDPFSTTVTTPPTLDELDRALALINKQLRASREAAGGRQAAGAVGGASSGVGRLGGGGLGGLGLPTEAQLLVGLTDFMVQRAKDDVAFGFVLTLRDQVSDDTWIRVGLPRSYQLMQQMDDRTYSTFLPVLRAAFVEDLNTLPGRAFLVADSLIPGVGPDTSVYLRGLAVAYQRGLEIRQGTPPAVALANLAGLNEAQMPDPTTRRALQVLGLVAREYAAGGGEAFARELARDDRGWLRRYLVAFVAYDLLRLDSTPADDKEGVLGFMRDREMDVLLLVNQLEAMRGVLQDAQRTAQAVAADLGAAASEVRDAAAQEQATLDRALAAAGAVLQVLGTGQRFLYWGDGDEPAEVGVFREFVTDANTLHQAFIKRDYASLVNWALQRPELSFCAAEVRSIDLIRADVRAQVSREIQSRRADGSTVPFTDRENDRMRQLVARRLPEAVATQERICGIRTQYLSFGASLASARTAEEVTVALRQASAPVGSFRAKRNQYDPAGPPDPRGRQGPWSASLGGYLGATGGFEEGGYHFGPTLPVGAEVSYGVPWGAVSVFVPVLDLGTLASVRFGGDEEGEDTDGDSEMEEDEEPLDETGPTFRQVLAPGVFLVWNISRTLPVSVGGGWQVVPDLRERGGDRLSVDRWTFFVAADVTMFNFRF